jgi:hypothetical protein
MKIAGLPLLTLLVACSPTDGGEQSAAGARDVHLSLVRVASAPSGPASEFRGTFQGTEPCLYFQDLGRSKIPVAFVNGTRWDPSNKGLVASGASGEDRLYRPGEWIIIEGWEVSSQSLGEIWAEPPKAACRGPRWLVVQAVAHNFPADPAASRAGAAQK